MKAVVIDMSMAGEIKILNARLTSKVNIISGYYLTVSPQDDPVRVTAAKLREEGLVKLPAYIIPPGALIQKHNFHFPRMPDKEIKKILPREIAGVTSSSERMAFNYLRNGVVEEQQAEKIEVSAFYCEEEI
ncbi:MAG: hypothetical protein GY950_29235, partial [bacterium]|nr:hypothetical protein [bacterium]